MAQCFLRRMGVYFKAVLQVQANPGATITAEGEVTYSAKADDNTGIATLYIKRKGIYKLSTDSTAELDADGNADKAEIYKNGTYTVQLVKLSAFDTVGVSIYKAGTNAVYWNKPETAFSGAAIRYLTNDYPTIETGTLLAETAGEELNIATGITNGYLHEGLTDGTTYYYSVYPYIELNGKKIYAASPYKFSKQMKAISQTVTVTESKTLTVPEGVRKISIFAVGAGGGGGSSHYQINARMADNYSAGAGGAGGSVVEKTMEVLPGMTLVCDVGAGGEGGAAAATLESGSTVSYKGNTGGTGGRTAVTVKNGETEVDSAIANGGPGGEGGSTTVSNDYRQGTQTKGGQGTTKGGSGAYRTTSSSGDATLHASTAGEDGKTERNGKKYGAGGGGGGLAHVSLSGSSYRVSSVAAQSNGGTAGGGNGGGSSYSSGSTVSGFDAINAAGADGAANTGAGGGGSCCKAKGGNGGSGYIEIVME